jgi:glycerol uptake facilitator-like aquaporin
MAPFFIGFSVAIIISVLAPLTQAGLNPARDLGPRLFAVLAGWGPIALPGPNGVWWAYVVGPFLGGPVGALLYDTLIRGTPADEEQPVIAAEVPASSGTTTIRAWQGHEKGT